MGAGGHGHAGGRGQSTKRNPRNKRKKKKELLVSILLPPQCSSSMKPAVAAKADPRLKPLPAEQWGQENGCSSRARAELAAPLPPAGLGIELQIMNASCSRTGCDRTRTLLKAASHSLLADMGHYTAPAAPINGCRRGLFYLWSRAQRRELPGGLPAAPVPSIRGHLCHRAVRNRQNRHLFQM